MNTTYPGTSMSHGLIARVRLAKRVRRQHWVDGRPVFRREAIGRVEHIVVLVASMSRVASIIRTWNTQIWEYRVLDIAPMEVAMVPPGTRIYHGPGESTLIK